jgi:hypothetical protein
MTTKHEEQLQHIERELAKQNEAWEETKRQILGLGDVGILIPRELVEEIEAAARIPLDRDPTFLVGVRA